ncbi:MAG: HEAT repeat domain-containing protein [Alphaproteobacteria bacterium]
MATTREVCDVLGNVLDYGDDIHRCVAAQALGRIGDPVSAEFLVRALRDEDEDVRADAAEALGRVGNGEAKKALIDSLVEDPCVDVKINAIAALGRLKAGDAIPVLRRLVRARDETIAWDDAEWFESGWDEWLDVQIGAIAALGQLGAVDAVPDIVGAIDDEMGQDVSECAMNALARLGEKGAGALENYLAVNDQKLRRRCVQALAGAGVEAVRTALDRALADPSPDVRLAAMRALASIESDGAEPAALFDDASPRVRAEAMRLWGRARPDRLRGALDDASEMVQIAALEALAANPPPAPAPELVRKVRVKLRDRSAEIAAAAAPALATLDPAVAFADLAECLREPTGQAPVRCAAAQALAGFGGQRAAHLLLQAVRDDERRVRLQAMMGLARLAVAGDGADLAREGLLAALQGHLVSPPEDDVSDDESHENDDRQGGIEASNAPAESPGMNGTVNGGTTPGTDRDASSVEGSDPESATIAWSRSTLESILGAESDVAKVESHRSAVRVAGEDIEYLELTRRVRGKRRVSPDPQIAAHEDVPRIAAKLLGDVAEADVARALAAALANSDVDVRRHAADSLARIGKAMAGLPAEVAVAVIDACADADRDVRLAAMRALAVCPAAVAASVAKEMTGDPDSFIRAEAVRALAVVGEAGDEIDRLMADDSPNVRLASAEALAAVRGAEALDRLVAFAFAFDGYHHDQAARLLRDIDPAAARVRILQPLADPKRKREWRIALQVLQELYRANPDGSDDFAATTGDGERCTPDERNSK